MSRAILKMLLARTIQREPSHTELAEFLAHCREIAGKQIYVPQHEPELTEAIKILELRAVGLSIRRIAREIGCSKSQVHIVLSRNSVFPVDSA